MYAIPTPLAAPSRDLWVGLVPLVIGLLIVGGLVLAVWYGIRLRRKGDLRPSGPAPEPPHNPKGYETQHRVPEAVPHDGHRRRPHELKDSGSAATGQAEEDTSRR